MVRGAVIFFPGGSEQRNDADTKWQNVSFDGCKVREQNRQDKGRMLRLGGMPAMSLRRPSRHMEVAHSQREQNAMDPVGARRTAPTSEPPNKITKQATLIGRLQRLTRGISRPDPREDVT